MKITWLWLFSLLFGMEANARNLAQQLVVENCHLDGIKAQVRCGTLQVPENYDSPKGKQIAINLR